MIKVIKTVIKNYLDNETLSDIMYAKVTSNNPIELQIEKITIPNSKIIVNSIFAKANIELKKGDDVLVLRQKGGQLFYILDKM